MVARTIIADPEKCQACRICTFQCAVTKSDGKTLLAAIQEGVPPRIRVIGNVLAIPNICRHCESICISNCPAEAIRRTTEGVVRIDDDKCIKCLLCLSACPFDVIKVMENTVTKCDLCYDRLAEGEIPACVESCPISRALAFEEPGIMTNRRFILKKGFKAPPRRHDMNVMALKMPQQIFDRISNIRKLARPSKVSSATMRKREEFTLPPIPPDAFDELEKIISTTEVAGRIAKVKIWKKED